MNIQEIKEGDRITFRSPTRDGNRKLTRVVNGFWPNGLPTVRAHGWGNFVVRAHEIQEIIPKEDASA
ncbi:hypothetical protein [Phaeobacter piscinae]|uniref:hypothetical protein n=1 Tax=Phaeobacter piscinae TaxID=1580596 RepID=UPI00058C2B58|nr:hypothetical protein [Phaeobacter piscinae]UTS82845.1 hypothetical protein OL67_003955 [Phaeobacter piscinae]